MTSAGPDNYVTIFVRFVRDSSFLHTDYSPISFGGKTPELGFELLTFGKPVAPSHCTVHMCTVSSQKAPLWLGHI